MLGWIALVGVLLLAAAFVWGVVQQRRRSAASNVARDVGTDALYREDAPRPDDVPPR